MLLTGAVALECSIVIHRASVSRRAVCSIKRIAEAVRHDSVIARRLECDGGGWVTLSIAPDVYRGANRHRANNRDERNTRARVAKPSRARGTNSDGCALGAAWSARVGSAFVAVVLDVRRVPDRDRAARIVANDSEAIALSLSSDRRPFGGGSLGARAELADAPRAVGVDAGAVVGLDASSEPSGPAYAAGSPSSAYTGNGRARRGRAAVSARRGRAARRGPRAREHTAWLDVDVRILRASAREEKGQKRQEGTHRFEAYHGGASWKS